MSQKITMEAFREERTRQTRETNRKWKGHREAGKRERMREKNKVRHIMRSSEQGRQTSRKSRMSS